MTLRVPSFINSADAFSRTVKLAVTPEDGVLEFKKDLEAFAATDQDARKKGQLEFCRDISAFANTHGGCIVLGVAESAENGRAVASSLHNLGSASERIEWMNQAIGNHLVPKTFPREMVPIVVDGNQLIAVNVPASIHLLSLWTEHASTIQCFRRTEHGKVAMNPDDVERHLGDRTRAARLEFARVLGEVTKQGDVDLAPGTYEYGDRNTGLRPTGERTTLGQCDEHQFQLMFPDAGNIGVAIPYAVLRASWVTFDGRLGLLLAVKLVWAGRDRGYRLE